MAKINEKQLKFCEEFVANGYKPGKAYSAAYENDNKNASSVGAYHLLRKPEIIDKIKEIEGNYKIISMQSGLDKGTIIRKIKEMLEAKKRIFNKDGIVIDETIDSVAVNSAINTWAKLTGEFEAEKRSIVVDDRSVDRDPSKMSKEEIEQEKARILKGL